jgi:Cu/Ag efflux pump CusA
VLSIIFLIGLIAMWRLPISEYPEVVPPTVAVQATYPGTNPKTISETVAVDALLTGWYAGASLGVLRRIRSAGTCQGQQLLSIITAIGTKKRMVELLKLADADGVDFSWPATQA